MIIHISIHTTTTHTTCTVLHTYHTQQPTAHTRDTGDPGEIFLFGQEGQIGKLGNQETGWEADLYRFLLLFISSLLLLRVYHLHILLLLSPSILPPSCTAKPYTVLYSTQFPFCFVFMLLNAMDTYTIYAAI
jgi:hypothetical protein